MAAPVVASMAAFRTLDEDDAQLVSRRSAQHPAFPGAHGSLALELVEARRRSGAVPDLPVVAGGPVRRLLPSAALGATAALWCGAVLDGLL